jgi:hypothetical protein
MLFSIIYVRIPIESNKYNLRYNTYEERTGRPGSCSGREKMEGSEGKREAGNPEAREGEEIKKVIIGKWDGCGLQAGKVEGDTFYFYDDQSYLESIYSKECFFENFEDALDAWIKDALREVALEGYVISRDIEILNKEEYVQRIFEKVEA